MDDYTVTGGYSPNIKAAIQEYVAAINDLHTTHSSTDVHNMGGMAGQAFTDHCAWSCHALERGADGEWYGIHEAQLERVDEARRELARLGLI